MTAKLTNRVSFYAESGYQFGFDDTGDDIRRDGAKGDIGFRIVW